MTGTMAARVRAALALAAAAGTTPIWLMTGWPDTHALPAEGTRP